MTFRAIFSVLMVALLLSSCADLNVFEQQHFFKTHEWDTRVQPEFQFRITDTASLYNIFIALRHEDAYRYNNCWVEITTQAPADSPRVQTLNLLLADNKKGWLGVGMDDIFDHRIRITRSPQKLKAGLYKFRLRQIMRENPLPAVLNVGVRVEKWQP